MAQRVTPSTTRSPAVPAKGRPGKEPPGRPPAGSVGAGQEAGSRSRRDFVEVVWSVFCSIRFAVVLNVGLALAAMLGTVIPQMPPGTRDFPQDLQNFLDTAKGRFGDLSGPFYWAGFYDLYNSLWFRILIVAVVFSIVICTLNRWQPIMRLITRPSVRVPDSFYASMSEKAQFRSVPVSKASAEEALRAVMRKSRYRVLSEPSVDGATQFFYGDRDRWSKLVTFVSHAALVMLIVTAAGLANAGWRDQSVFFYPGQPVPIGHGTDFSVRNDGFSIDYYPDGKTIKEFKDRLTVIEGERDVLSKTIIVNSPLSYKDVNVFLVSYQPVLYVKAVDGQGQAATLSRMGQEIPSTEINKNGEVLLKFQTVDTDNNAQDLIQLPSADKGKIITLQLTYYQDLQRFFVKGYEGAFTSDAQPQQVYADFLPANNTLKLPGYGDYTFQFRQDTATVLEIAKDPGLGLVGSWFVIMTLGFAISLYTTFTRCWAKVTPSTATPGAVDITIVGLAEKNKVSFERDFEKLATRLKEALVARARSEGRKLPDEALAAQEESLAGSV